MFKHPIPARLAGLALALTLVTGGVAVAQDAATPETDPVETPATAGAASDETTATDAPAPGADVAPAAPGGELSVGEALGGGPEILRQGGAWRLAGPVPARAGGSDRPMPESTSASPISRATRPRT